jgi:hypothetical protein
LKLDFIEIISETNRKKILIGNADGKKTRPIKNKYFPEINKFFSEKKDFNLIDIFCNIYLLL